MNEFPSRAEVEAVLSRAEAARGRAGEYDAFTAVYEDSEKDIILILDEAVRLLDTDLPRLAKAHLRAMELLKKWGTHAYYCKKAHDYNKDCNCGLGDARALVRKFEEGKKCWLCGGVNPDTPTMVDRDVPDGKLCEVKSVWVHQNCYMKMTPAPGE